MLSKFSVNKPYTVVVAVILVIILGFISFTGMKTDLLPSMNLPYAIVVTTYPGATPEEVETVVTKPVEQSMATVSNIKTVASQSSENMSMVILEFHQETNMDSVTLEMRENLDLISSAWTDDTIASPMIMKINPDMMPVMVASVDNEGMDHDQLSAFVSETILPGFERIEGVASVTATGLADESIKVTIDQERIDLVNDAIAAAIDGDINKARSALNQARKELNSASSQINSQVQAGKAQIAQGEEQIAAAKDQIAAGEKELETTITGLEAQKTELENQKETLVTQKASLEGQIKKLEDAGTPVPEELLAQKAEIDGAIAKVDGGLSEINAGLDHAQAGKDEISAQKDTLSQKEKELQAGKAEMESQVAAARSQIAQGKSEIESQSAALESQAKTAKEDAAIDDIITVDMISGILAAQNFSMPAGSLESDATTYTVKVGDNLNDVEELENILLFELDLDGVDDVRLQDVATVAMTDAAEDTYAKVNGNEGVLLAFQKQSSYSTSEVSERINETIAQMEKEHEGLTVTSFMDQGIYIKMITDSVLNNLLYGAVLAIFILLLFLRDMRPTLIVALSIPASVLFALVMMYFTGVTLNMISLSGLALGVGMLVDNSIVVIENIYRLRREGVDRKTAAIEGAKQVSGAIIASTLTTICVFFPIVFTDGMSKELFMDMGLTIAFSLIASLLVALSLVPSMANGILRKEYKGEGKFFKKFQNGYEKVLRCALRFKFVVIIGVIGLLAASAYFAVAQGTSFIPEGDSTEMTATITVEKEQSQEELWSMADTFMERSMEIPEVTAVGGMDNASGGMGGMSSSSGSQSVSFYLLLDEDKTRSNKAIAKDLQKAGEDLDCEVSVTASSMDMSALGGSGIQLQVKGDDLDTLGEITQDMSQLLKDTEGIDEVTDAMEDANPELVITVDKDKAMAEGFTVAQVYATVSSAIDTGNQASTLNMDGKDYPIIVVDGNAETMTAAEIADIPLKPEGEAAGTPGQSAQPGGADQEEDEDEEELTVGDVATISEKQSPSAITRTGQERYMTVSATVDSDYNLGLVADDVKAGLDSYEVPEGYSVEIAGESVTVEDAISDLVKVILLALVLTYLIMVAQFQSLLSPFIVMFTVPLAFTGGFLALIITGMDVSVIAMLGFLVLTGVVVNNGIVLVDYINQLMAQGMPQREAIVLGGKTRIRPVMMTALTTILALITMAMGVGMGAEMVQPMAVVCIGGLAYATLLTVFFVPVMYDIFHRKQRRAEKKAAKARKKQAKLEDADKKQGDE